MSIVNDILNDLGNPASIDMREPLPSVTDASAPWPTLHPDALYGPLGEIVRTISPHTEADPVGLLADLLASFGNCVGSGPHSVADAARHPARLNVVLVGATAKGRKGTIRAQISRLFDEASPDWSTRRVMGGLSTGEGLISHVRDPIDADDKTAPNDKRLLVVEPEFARVLAVANRDGNVLSAIVRDCWDSGRLRVMTRKDPLVATGAHVSILGHITVDELVRKLNEVEVANGFANRMLFFLVQRSKLLPEGGSLHPDEAARLVELLRVTLERSRPIGVVGRNAEARDLWATMYEDLSERDAPGLVGAITARAETQLLRLSVAYALADGSSTVTPTHLRAAWAVWNYAEDSARYIWRAASGDPDADALYAAIVRAGDRGLSGEDQRRVFSGHRPAEQMERIRNSLGERIVTIKVPSGGRPTTLSFASEHADAARSIEEGNT